MQERVVSCGVTRPPSDYRILVGCGLVERLGWEMRELGLSGTTVVVSDDAVFPQYGARVQNALESEGFGVRRWVVPRGEGTKCLAWAERTYDFMVEQRVERGDCVVALGGGMVGDLAGFVAATFLRGISLVQVPTSLVAMVDASIGGKVGVNHPLGKNLIGAFYQPKLVVVDPGCLGTLPGRELRSGWAEVVKYGAIQDRELFEVLGSSAESLMELETEAVIEAVARSAAIKARIVEEDEREAGKRMILNYGHSIGHGLEAATGYSQFLHGEAVAVGMTGAAMLSERMGLLPAEAARRQQRVLKRFGLPTGFTGVGVGDVVKAMELDKKVREGSLRWVLLEDIGRSVVRRDVPRDMVLGVLEDLSRG